MPHELISLFQVLGNLSPWWVIDKRFVDRLLTVSSIVDTFFSTCSLLQPEENGVAHGVSTGAGDKIRVRLDFNSEILEVDEEDVEKVKKKRDN